MWVPKLPKAKQLNNVRVCEAHLVTRRVIRWYIGDAEVVLKKGLGINFSWKVVAHYTQLASCISCNMNNHVQGSQYVLRVSMNKIFQSVFCFPRGKQVTRFEINLSSCNKAPPVNQRIRSVFSHRSSFSDWFHRFAYRISLISEADLTTVALKKQKIITQYKQSYLFSGQTQFCSVEVSRPTRQESQRIRKSNTASW